MNFPKNFPRNSEAANKSARPNKTSDAYWHNRVRKDPGSSNYNVTIMHKGAKRNVSLGTTNQRAAAKRAAQLYVDVRSTGWSGALARLVESRGKKLQVSSGSAKSEEEDKTNVAWFIKEASGILAAKVRPSTLNAYTCAFRCIVRESGGGARISLKAADARPLGSITSDSISAWRENRLKRRCESTTDLDVQNSEKRTINATIRNAAALFNADILSQIAARNSTSAPLNPFSGIKPLPVHHKKYQTKIDIGQLLKATRDQFKKDNDGNDGTDAAVWIIFVLALFAGLRANEIDKLLWTQVNFETKFISITPTAVFTGKSSSSHADVPLEDQALEELKWYLGQCGSDPKFVVCPNLPIPAVATGPERRRLNAPFTILCKWLRNYEQEGTKPLSGVQKPIHELRKEAGSTVMRQSDIFRASLFLRHSDIQTTVRHYADSRPKNTVGLGHLLAT